MAVGEDDFDLQWMARELAGTPFAGRVEHFAEIGSTNTYALEQGAAGAPHGSVYVADAQTAGRGRGAHGWVSPPAAGLYVSVLLRPRIAPADTLAISLAAGLAVLHAVRATTELVPDLRWPNDLLFGARKVAGILTEMHAEATRVRYVVVGMGINVHHREFPPELRESATSLAMEGAHVGRPELLTALLRALEEETRPLMDAATVPGATREVLKRVEAASSWTRGKQVVGDEGQGGAPQPFRGVTAGLDERGFLQVRTSDGMRTVLSGGVRERGA